MIFPKIKILTSLFVGAGLASLVAIFTLRDHVHQNHRESELRSIESVIAERYRELPPVMNTFAQLQPGQSRELNLQDREKLLTGLLDIGGVDTSNDYSDIARSAKGLGITICKSPRSEFDVKVSGHTR